MSNTPILPEKAFVSHAPGYWKGQRIAPEDWNNYAWQLRNRVTTLEQLEQHLVLCQEERAGVLLSGDKLAMAITPHYFNLIHKTDPDCPIRRQVVPRIEETLDDPQEMADPCGEDAHMPVPGLVHRYPDRVLFLITDRCASYCRYCTRSRVVSGVGVPCSRASSETPSTCASFCTLAKLGWVWPLRIRLSAAGLRPANRAAALGLTPCACSACLSRVGRLGDDVMVACMQRYGCLGKMDLRK
jgi:hypothetical protein